MKVALLCSWGGHLQEMMDLREAWEIYDYHFYTYDSKRSRALNHPKTLIHPPWLSKIKFLRDLFRTLTHITFNKPDVLISSGMGWVDIFVFPYCKLLRCKTIYIESAANVKEITGTARLIRRFCNHFFVQWEELAEEIGAEYGGGAF